MYVRIAVAALAVAALTVLAGCGGSAGETSSPAATTAAAPTTATAPASPEVKQIDLDVEGGKINGGAPPDVSIDQGQKVELHVQADVADEVHVHGYDLHGDVAPGEPATISFTADVPGRFEAELESRGLQILRFTVNP